ncbi:hypothetical protein [Mesobaculum littorinae]|uniref:hypothetical protein n=1 Tax=Mesobaculum littorinae TaxID=2486419 RepID=UPI0013E2ED3C|nr:hypothetical protein [Mesobaculum littorinae]
MKLFTTLRSAARRRAAYNRTVAELSNMSVDTALDLNIFHEDVHSIARRAVYGR